MPTSDEILAGLTAIANRAVGIAIAWHVALGASAIALIAGWRPSPRTARLLLVLPLASVAALAFGSGNPFNGVMFSAAAAGLAALDWGAPAGIAGRGAAAAGIASIAFGWVYPHFLSLPAWTYLFAAPVGVVPCPTLAVVIGLALLGPGLGARRWSLALAAFGLFYGLFGVLRLGVVLDLGLVAAATVLAVSALRRRTR